MKKEKRLNRFEREVQRNRLAGVIGKDRTKIIKCDEAAKLLRREHAWMMRMVRGLTVYRFPGGPFVDPYYISRQALLRKLTQRRK